MSYRMQLKHCVILTLPHLITCTTTEHEFLLETFPTTKDAYESVSSISLYVDPSLPKVFKDQLNATISSCEPFKSLENIDQRVSLREFKSKNKLDIELSKFETNTHSQLFIELVSRKNRQNLEKTKAFLIKDSNEFERIPNANVPTLINPSFASSYEIAPKQDIKQQNILIKNEELEYIIDFAFYNKLKNKLAVSDTIRQAARLSTFSRKPVVDQKVFESANFASLAKLLSSRICKGSSNIESLYAPKGDDEKSKLIQTGVEQASQGKWALAANNWQAVVKNDFENVFANHNLGLYYESIGKPELAAFHYTKLLGKKLPESMENSRHEEFLNSAQYPSLSQSLVAQVIYITPGNWVFMHPMKAKVAIPGYHSLYRMELIKDRNLQVVGSKLREIGKIKITEKRPDFWIGRIQQSTIDYPPGGGDFIFSVLK